jgi:hypothetical protein
MKAPTTAATAVIRHAMRVKRFMGDPPTWDDRGLRRPDTSMAGEQTAGQIDHLTWR